MTHHAHNTVNLCSIHRNERPLGRDEICACPHCGRLLAFLDCRGCGKSYLQWHGIAGGILPLPAYTPEGELICKECLARAPFLTCCACDRTVRGLDISRSENIDLMGWVDIDGQAFCQACQEEIAADLVRIDNRTGKVTHQRL